MCIPGVPPTTQYHPNFHVNIQNYSDYLPLIMTRNFIIAAILAILSISVPFTNALASHHNNESYPDWTFHSAFNNSPRKIMDSERYTYFFVFQQLFSKTDYSGYVSNPTGAIFRFDKQNPAEGMKDLAQLAPISGFDMRQAALDPETGLLVIAYCDGGVDFILPDLSVKYFDNLKKLHTPGSIDVNAISFDPKSHDVWIATSSGFMHIGYDSLTPLHVTEWGKKVNDIIPVGNGRTMAIIDGKITLATEGADIRYADSFNEIASATSGVPARLMPLSDLYVAYMSENGSFSQLQYTPSTDKWKRTAKNGTTTKDYMKPEINAGNASAWRALHNTLINRVEHSVIPTANGYYASSNTEGYFINRPVSETDAPTFVKQPLPTGSSISYGLDNSNVYTHSYDGSTFWLYKPRGKFECRKFDGTDWSEPIHTIAPNAPLVVKDIDFVDTEKYGMIAVTRCPMMRSSNLNDINHICITSLKDGKWNNLSPIFYTPYLAENNPAAIQNIQKYNYAFPVGDPMGFKIDPKNPEFFFAGSGSSGFCGGSLADPRKVPAIFHSEGDDRYNEIGAYTLFDRPTWNSYNGLYVLGFDGLNNLWALRTLTLSSKYSGQGFGLYYWNESDRNRVMNADTPPADHGVVELIIPSDVSCEFWVSGTTLMHPDNGTKLILSCQGGNDGGAAFIVYDHNGTPDNIRDDKMTFIRKFKTNNGALRRFVKAFGYAENPFTGELVLLEHDNVFVIDPKAPVVDGIIDAKILSFATPDGDVTDFLPDFIATAAAFDEYGRLWIATETNGVFGFSPDYSTQIAHFNTTNSPLPTDRTFGVGWNRERKSLFISTELAIAEVKVDSPTAIPTSGNTDGIFMVPEYVKADYTGSVSFYNIPANSNLRIRDAKGNTIRILERNGDGQTHWDLLDSDGKSIKSGIYTITDAALQSSFDPIIIPIAR